MHNVKLLRFAGVWKDVEINLNDLGEMWSW